MKKMVVAAGILSILFSFSTAAFAYETIEVKNGGSIEGVVEYAGASVPKDQMVKLSSETKYCGQSMPAEKYLIKDKKIKNVAVYIEEIKAGKAAPAEPVTL